MEFTIYCDMDGVLCNFEKKFRELYNDDFKSYSEKNSKREGWSLVQKHGVKFWSDLEWTKDGKDLWNFLKKIKNVEILTGSPKKLVGIYAKVGKEMWVEREICKDIKVNHIEGKSKYKFISTKNDILIDDSLRNCKLWRENGGISILHKNTKTTISELEKILEKES